MYNTPLLPDAAYTDIGLAKDTTDKVAKDYKVKTNNNNGRTNVNKHTNPTGNYTRFNNKISFEVNLSNLSKGFSELNNKDNNHKQRTESI